MIINPYIFGQAPLLLDLYPNAATAYSVRKLRTSYTGNCLRVRRSSDNAEQNIGFVNNELDTVSLLSFVGAGNGFVTTWYDQSGNSNDAINPSATLQPRIVNLGILETQNSKPTIFFDGSNDRLFKTDSNTFANNNYRIVFIANRWNTIPTVIKYLFAVTSPTGNLRYAINSTSNVFTFSARRLDGDITMNLNSISTFNNTDMYLSTGIIDYTNTDAHLYFNGNLENSNLSALTTGLTPNALSIIYIGAIASTTYSNSNISEIITYTSPPNISSINTNIQTFFNI